MKQFEVPNGYRSRLITAIKQKRKEISIYHFSIKKKYQKK